MLYMSNRELFGNHLSTLYTNPFHGVWNNGLYTIYSELVVQEFNLGLGSLITTPLHRVWNNKFISLALSWSVSPSVCLFHFCLILSLLGLYVGFVLWIIERSDRFGGGSKSSGWVWGRSRAIQICSWRWLLCLPFNEHHSITVYPRPLKWSSVQSLWSRLLRLQKKGRFLCIFQYYVLVVWILTCAHIWMFAYKQKHTCIKNWIVILASCVCAARVFRLWAELLCTL